ncbi:MAG TPA: hypothetical protein VFS00_00145 [Polyangiaceae bacterium]|nr:hypothetical protein [Polyangiaceae bacterium]
MPLRSPLLALLFTFAAASGCARSGQGAPTADGHLTLVASGGARQLKLEGRNLFGARTNVSFFGDGYRGVYDQHQIVDLRPTGRNTISGSIASQPTELSIEEGPSWLQVRGLYRGRVSSFFLTPTRLQGIVGNCTYTLRANQESSPNQYFGGSACGRWGGGTSLTLFEGFAGRPTRERVVALTLLLGAD